MPINLHSKHRQNGLKQRWGHAAITITEGEYKGYKCYGPYMKSRKGKESVEYYRLRKGDDIININADEFDLEGLTRTKPNDKPFLDFLK